MKYKNLSVTVLFFVCILAPLYSLAVKFPDKPSSAHYYVDKAGLISESSGKQINAVAKKLLTEKEIPVYVVTIQSLSHYDASDYSIERYTAALFNHWGLGRKSRNYGMLLLISKNDRKARIELGKGWAGQYDAQTQQIMTKLIIPAFKRSDYSLGIVDGVRGLDRLARGLDLPVVTAPWWFLPLVIGVFILIILIIINLFKKGRSGWAWVLIVGLGVILFFILRNSGKGSAGGGGSTGSW